MGMKAVDFDITALEVSNWSGGYVIMIGDQNCSFLVTNYNYIPLYQLDPFRSVISKSATFIPISDNSNNQIFKSFPFVCYEYDITVA